MPAEKAFDVADTLPMADMVDPPAPPPTPAESGKRFAFLVAGVVVILLLAENVKNIKALPRKVTQDKKMVAAWAAFAALMYAGYIYQPEAEDPSITITFGAGVQLFTFVLLWVMPRRKPEYSLQPTGDSAEFALLMAVALALRLSSTCRFQGYLPTDATGDGCYQALEGLGLLLALRGLLGTGLTPRQGVHCVLTVLVSALFSLACYGDLDRRPVWDRVYASSVYVEVLSWGFLAGSMLRAGPERTIKPAFLVPAIGHAALRASFWYVAQDEMYPRSQARLMGYFPLVIVFLHFVLAASLLVLGLLILCAPEKDLPSDTKKVHPTPDAHEPLMSLMASALTSAGSSASGLASGLVPVRAVFEDGKLRVEYSTGAKEAVE